MFDLNDFTVIVRSSDERTAGFCQHLLEKKFKRSSVFRVTEKPFTESIKQSFKVGIKQGRKWTICIDADVLIEFNGIDTLLDSLEGLDSKAFVVQGLVFDKFFGVLRPAGNHIYQTSLLPKALNYVDEFIDSMRPESDLINYMMRLGYPWFQLPHFVGYHDFEQSYQDIFRKCHLQAHKHRHLFYLLAKRWKKLASNDFDFQVAYWGLYAGLTHMESVRVDRDLVNIEFQELSDFKGLHIKPEMQLSDSYERNDIKEDEELQEVIFPRARWYRVNQFKKDRFRKMVLWLGSLLERLGKKIQYIVSN